MFDIFFPRCINVAAHILGGHSLFMEFVPCHYHLCHYLKS